MPLPTRQAFQNDIATSVDTPPLLPFLKWPGGKRWLAARLCEFIRPNLTGVYREPFLGGGAVFYALRPNQAHLSDINEELILTYRTVRSRHRELLVMLKSMPVTKSFYYQLRAKQPTNSVERAARFLFLNRTAFGGMYRVNQAGGFNVPFGGGQRTPALLWESSLLKDAAKALKSALLRTEDFELAIDRSRKGDVVYCDPTYTVAHNNNGFIRYNELNFSWADQERLAKCARRAAARGALVIVSNAFHKDLLDLYQPPQLMRFGRNSCLSTNAKFRQAVEEYVFVFPPSHANKTQGRR